MNIAQILKKAHSTFPVNQWMWNDYHVWPVICGIIHNSMFINENEDHTKMEKKKRNYLITILKRPLSFFKRFGVLIYKYGKYICINDNSFFLLKKASNIYLSDGISKTNIEGVYYENFFSDVIQEKTKNLESNLIFDPGTGSELYPTSQKTMLLNFRSYFVYLKARFTRIKKIPNWTDYDKFLKFIGLNLGNSIRERLEINRIKQDFNEIEEWSKVWEKIIAKTDANKAYIIAYYNTIGWGLCRACSKTKIPSVEIQHGVISENVVPYIMWDDNILKKYSTVPSEFYVWSNYEKKSLSSNKLLSRNVKVKGHQWINYIRKNESFLENIFDKEIIKISKLILNSRVNILIAHQPFKEWCECYEPILKLIKKRPDWNFWLKFHPLTEKQNNLCLDGFLNIKEKNLIINEANSAPAYLLLKYINCIVTPESSMSIEASFLNIKTVFLSDSALINKKFLIDQNQAIIAKNIGDIEKQIIKFVGIK